MRQQHTARCERIYIKSPATGLQIFALIFGAAVLVGLQYLKTYGYCVALISIAYVLSIRWLTKKCIPTIKHDSYNFNVKEMFVKIVDNAWAFCAFPLIAVGVAIFLGNFEIEKSLASVVFGDMAFVVYFEATSLGYIKVNADIYEKGSIGFVLSDWMMLVGYYFLGTLPVLM